MEDVIEEQDVDYSAMTTGRKRQKFNRLQNDNTFKPVFKKRESQDDIVQDLFKPKVDEGEDAMNQVILKYTNVIPK